MNKEILSYEDFPVAIPIGMVIIENTAEMKNTYDTESRIISYFLCPTYYSPFSIHSVNPSVSKIVC